MQIESPHSVRAEGSGHININRIDISDRTLSVMAITFAAVAILMAYFAERETKLMREDYRVMSIALARHGVNTDEHALETGEDK